MNQFFAGPLQGVVDQRIATDAKKHFRNRMLEEIWDEKCAVGKCKWLTKVLPGGVRIRCYSDSFLSQLIYTEVFENTELEFVRHYLRRGDVFVDIGANIGLFTVIAAHVVKESGQVFAIEPVESTFLRLCENLKLNRFANVVALRLAIGHETGTMQMQTSLEGFDAFNTFGVPSRGDKFMPVNVKVSTLDQLVEEHSLMRSATLIKIDVEGWELRVVEGGRSLFESLDAPTLLVEFTDENAKGAGSNCHELYRYIESFGYSFYVYDSDSCQLIPDPMRSSYPYANLVACKNKAMVEERVQSRIS